MPALNDLLSSWGIAFSSEVLEGETTVSDHKIHYASGTAIAQFPLDGSLLARDLNDQGTYIYIYIYTRHTMGLAEHHHSLGATWLEKNLFPAAISNCLKLF